MASPQSPEIDDLPAATAGDVDPGRRRLRWLLVGAAGLVLMLLIRGFIVESFSISSGSMEPTLLPDDRILVNKIAVASSLQRGDVVVFDGTHNFADPAGGTAEKSSGPGRILGSMASMLSFQANESDYVKRVVGLPGDHVVCCDPNGLLVVNNVAVGETYLFQGDRPSDLTFDVKVPSGRVWLMGDHRSNSADSRAHLGDPGGGMVRLDDVIGRAAMVYWPPSRSRLLAAPESLSAIPATATGESHK